VTAPTPLELLNQAIAQLEAKVAQNPDVVALRAMLQARTAITGLGPSQATLAALGALVPMMEPGDSIEQTSADSYALRRRRPSQADAAAMGLSEAGAPLGTRALIPFVEKHGQPVGGDDPVLNLSSIMSKDPRFESIEWRGTRAWWFKGRPTPGSTVLASIGGPVAGGPLGGADG
jgi:hypothetical protein